MSQKHFLNENIRWPMNVAIIGCGGNGSQMLTGLANLELALHEIGERSMNVTTFDNDTVSQANLGRQPFFPCDIGRNKAIVLTERINMAYGMDWTATPSKIDMNSEIGKFDLIISCVDTAASRRTIGALMKNSRRQNPAYWLDLGNRATDGQIVLGQVANAILSQPRLQTVLELFPEITQSDYVEDDQPSCSLAEALEKQSLFINRTIASHALAMLFDLLVRGSISYPGLFINISAGLTMPMAMPTENPKQD